MGSTERVHFGFGRSLDVPFADAIERVKGAFKAEGFGVITEVVRRPHQAQVVGPTTGPALGHFGDSSPGGTVRTEQSDVQCVRIVHRHTSAQGDHGFGHVLVPVG